MPPPRTGARPPASTARPPPHGRAVHLLLQLAAERGALPPGAGEAHAEAAAVLADPALAWIFRPEGGAAAA